jgi:guanylate kinase
MQSRIANSYATFIMDVDSPSRRFCMAGILFIISAPSGSGKSTLVNELRREVRDLEFSVSYTTRAPRGSEQHGHEYYFVTRDEFERMIARDDFLEYADVFGNYYGTAKHVFRDASAHGKDLLLDIDVQGAAQVKARHPEAVSIFVLPPSRQVLEKRLKNRSLSDGNMSDEVVERRLLAARKEIENSLDYDYSLVNDRLDESVDQLRAIVLCERAKRAGDVSHAELQALADPCRQVARTGNPKLREILDSFGQAVRS